MNFFQDFRTETKLLLAVALAAAVFVVGAILLLQNFSQPDETVYSGSCAWRPDQQDYGPCEVFWGSYFDGEKCIGIGGCGPRPNVPFSLMEACNSACVSIPPQAKRVFPTQEECEAQTGYRCDFVTCDINCPEGFQKGWSATEVKPQQIDTSGWQTYRNDEFGFEVKYPLDWESIQGDQSGLRNQTDYAYISIDSVPIKTGQEMLDVVIANTGMGECSPPDCRHPGEDEVFMRNFDNHLFYYVFTNLFEGRLGVAYYIENPEGDTAIRFGFSAYTGSQNWPLRGEHTDEEEPDHDILKQILSTFRFVEGEKSIQEIDFASYFSSIPPYSDCDEVAPSLSAVFVNNIEYFDVTDDGREEAIVIASSCYTHTAGPDIVGVYQANLDGEIQPLEFKESLQSHLIRWNPNKQVLIGFTGAYEAGDRNCCPSKEKIVEYQWDNNIQRFRILSEETRERVHRNKAFWDDDCYIDTVAC